MGFIKVLKQKLPGANKDIQKACTTAEGMCCSGN
jgi:hypothetical protein